MASFERLINLYNQLGLNTEAGTFNRAEIRGYCAGFDMLNDVIGVSIDEKNISKSVDFLLEEFINELISVADDMLNSSKGYTFLLADYEKVGHFARSWLIPYYDVYLDGNGMPWQSYNKRWIDIDNMLLRWSMIETLGGV